MQAVLPILSLVLPRQANDYKITKNSRTLHQQKSQADYFQQPTEKRECQGAVIGKQSRANARQKGGSGPDGNRDGDGGQHEPARDRDCVTVEASRTETVTATAGDTSQPETLAAQQGSEQDGILDGGGGG